MVGAFNGFFVAFVRLQPIVVTLSSMFIVQGITLLVADKPGGAIAPEFVAFEPHGRGHLGRVSRYSAWAGWPFVSNAVGRSARA